MEEKKLFTAPRWNDVPQATELADRLGFADHAVLNTAECVDVLISNLEEQKLGCTDL
jgi:hypothetical protein